MRKGRKTDSDDIDMREEYDFSKARPNKYAERYTEGGSLVVIDPALSRFFPDSDSVNAALQSLVPTLPQTKSE